jgi:ATP-dependent metalloprotease
MPQQIQSFNSIPGSHAKSPLYFKNVPESSWESFKRSVLGSVFSFMVFAFLVYNFIHYMAGQITSGAGTPLHKEASQHQKGQQVVTFADVKGCDEAKNELQEIVNFLKNPEQFTRLGGKLPKGVLLLGPPGTGKTLLAKAVAGEAGVPFFFCSGSEFEEMYVGVGAKRVRDLFAAAKKKAPCIVFIDEIDAIGGRRQVRETQSATRMTLNQLLTELDGFQTNSGVIVIGATNFPKVLDKALVRPGRFDKHVTVPLPDVRGRQQILELYAGKMTMGKDVELSKVARGTPGCSGAQLYNLINTAALAASNKGRKMVTMADLEDARDTILMGAERKSLVQTDADKRNTAYHEGGHTIMAIKTKGAYPIHKATILPRGQALGVTHMLPERDEYALSKQQLVAKLDVAMGGYVAEELVFGPENVTSGASNDLESATLIAREMVMRYGMGQRLGRVAPEDTSNLSQETKKMIDEDVKTLVDGAYDRAKTVLSSNIHDLHRLAKALQTHETLDSTEIMDVMRGKEVVRQASAY